MTEDEAQNWLADRGWWDGPQGDRLRGFATMVLDEANRQNLISAASKAEIWSRHIVDSAQLLVLASNGATQSAGFWADLGTGAGFPGLVVACLREAPIILIEARPLRAQFLERCASELNLVHVKVVTGKVEQVKLPEAASVISARAYAPLDRLLSSAHHLSGTDTVWLLPKGRSGRSELHAVQPLWDGVFHVEQSLTDAESVIVTVSGLQRREKGIRGARRPASHYQPWRAGPPKKGSQP